jgi:hypothetical protein
MAFQRGVLGRVELANVKILGLSRWLYEGMQRRVFDISEFGDDIDVYEYGPGQTGTVSIIGNRDVTDLTGQEALRTSFTDRTVYTEGQVKFFIGNDDYFTVQSGGEIAVLVYEEETARNEVMTVKIGFGVSGGFLIRMTRHPLVWDEFIVWEPGILWDSGNFS